MNFLSLLFCLLWAFPVFSSNCEIDSRTLFRRERLGHPRLSLEEERAEFEKYAQTRDREVANKIVKHFFWLVEEIAREFRHRYKGDIMDIIQEGNIGLFEAIERYHLEEGVQFSTFASHRIRGSIKDNLDKYLDLVRPKLRPKKRKKFVRLKEELLSQGKSVFEEKNRIAEEMGISVELVTILDSQLSMNNEIGLEDALPEGMALMDKLSNQNTHFANDVFANDPIFRFLQKHLAKFLANHSIRNRKIFLNFYLSSNPLTGVELARKYNIHETRVSQIKNSMKEKFKKYMYNNFDPNR